MDVTTLIERFFYLGRLQPFYTKSKKFDPPEEMEQILIVRYFPRLPCEQLKACMKRCLSENLLPRRNELWYTYALYLANPPDAADRIFMTREFPELALTAEDLFLFAHYASKIQECHSRKGFPRYVRKAITQWYITKTPLALGEFLAEHRGLCKWTHKDLISYCHIKFSNVANEIVTATFHRGCKTLKTLERQQAADLSEAMALHKITSEFKICEDVNMAQKMITDHGLKLEHVPQHLLHHQQIWDPILPDLSCKKLLEIFFLLSDKQILERKKIRDKYIDLITAKMTEAGIHPIVFQILAHKQKSQMRYSEKVKAERYARLVKRKEMKPNPMITKSLTEIFYNSFNYCPKINARIMVTINLQKNYDQKSVTGNRQITVHEASVTLALAFLRGAEKGCNVYRFTEDTATIKKIPWTKEMSYESAKETCKALMCETVSQRIYIPITEATLTSEDYDLFVIIVATATLGNRLNAAPTEVLNRYRKYKNKEARVLIINLRRCKPSLTYRNSTNVNFFEICGLDDNFENILEAYLKKYLK